MQGILYWLLKTLLELAGNLDFGFTPETYELVTSWYFFLWGADCTTDLDRVNQGEYVITMLVNILWHLLTGSPSLYEACVLY